MISQNKRHTGFTLVELLVVISIISLIASVILASLNGARAKARDAKRLADIRQIKTALELYYNDNGYYPSVGNDNGGYEIPSLTTPLQVYLSPIPTDPSGTADPFSRHWQYVRGLASDNSYGLYVYVEKTNIWCRTGVNVNPGWWNATGYVVSNCSF